MQSAITSASSFNYVMSRDDDETFVVQLKGHGLPLHIPGRLAVGDEGTGSITVLPGPYYYNHKERLDHHGNITRGEITWDEGGVTGWLELAGSK